MDKVDKVDYVDKVDKDVLNKQYICNKEEMMDTILPSLPWIYIVGPSIRPDNLW